MGSESLTRVPTSPPFIPFYIPQILTVNQTLDIIHAQLELKDWQKALERVVPTRKRKAAEEADGDEKAAEADGDEEGEGAKK